MHRLFLAIPLPESATSQLHSIQPEAGRGVRVTSTEQMHLTLHFIGPGRVDEIASAISGASSPPFVLEVRDIGHFDSRDGAMILWAGVMMSEPLLALHRELGKCLRSIGIRLDERPFNPHITLARGPATTLLPVLEEILISERSLAISPYLVTDFRLYSSDLRPEGPVYREERRFSLGSS